MATDIFNLIPTEIDEYKVYADWLEDQGVILTAAVRQGILSLHINRHDTGGDAFYEDGFCSEDEGDYCDGSGFCQLPYGRAESRRGEGCWNNDYIQFNTY